MEIIKFPDPRLFTKCRPVTVFGPELIILLESMWETMVASRGIGLASNQVGLEYNMFTMEGPNKEKLFIVNPKIVARSQIAANLNEGCLSAPGEYVRLKERSRTIEIEYQNECGVKTTAIFSGIHAVCVQHEMDHLLGRSFMQSRSIPKSQRKALKEKWGLV